MQYVGLGLHDILAYQNWTDWENPRGVTLWIVELGRPLSSPPNSPLRLEAKEGRRLLGMKVIWGLEGFTVQQSNSTQMSYCGLCDWVHIQNSLGTNWKARRERVPKICLEGVRKDIKVFFYLLNHICFMIVLWGKISLYSPQLSIFLPQLLTRFPITGVYTQLSNHILIVSSLK